MPLPLKDAALIIVGHGSTLNPDSSAPTHRHADEIRRRGIFSEVVCAFWKEEPSMREVYHMITSREIYIVPNFISEGYFCQQVIPRELRLDGPVTQRDGRTIYYCDPVGIHPSMTRLLLKRAEEVAPCVPREKTALIIVGHGTSLNDNSRKAIEDQVTLIREGGYGFAEVMGAYMEEAPFVAKWTELTSAENVVVVPFFIADGLHSYQDIPVLLGMVSEPTAAASQGDALWQNPHELQDRKLYYSRAIGTEDLMAEVILDQVHDTQAKHQAAKLEHTSTPDSVRERQPFSPLFTIGQILCSQQPGGSWRLHHKNDTAAELAESPLYTSPADAREIANTDASGNFRPLKSAPTLKGGWKMHLQDDGALRLALDFFYPAAVGMWEHELAGQLPAVPLRETLGRQTGMYRFANKISDQQAQELVSCQCDPDEKCLRRITWPLTSDEPLTLLPPEKQLKAPLPQDEIPVLCVEACTFIVSAAREISRENNKAASQ